MKAAVLTATGFQINEEKIPEYGPDQILVKSSGCGVCEGDVFQYITRMNNPESRQEFIRMGHEGSGIVAETGRNVTGFKPGDKVTALGGDYAEYFVTTPDRLAIVPGSIESSMALGEPIACCMSGARRFGVEMGDRVAIIGAGYMGLTCMQLVKLQGAAETVVFDLLDWRLEKAGSLGADVVINSKGKTPAELFARLGEFDVVIEATGVQAAIDLGTELLRHHGTLNLVGYHQSGGGIRQIDMKTWNFKALTVINSHVRNEAEKLDAMKAALKLMAHGKLDTNALITNYRFADINQAFQDLKARKEGLYKANLIF
ncbi:MAG: zinc-binding dehydrogenase [Victivallaceae bacterium]|jgi:threonine dehydrogenase-like Zn-dependent dehydrogenase